MPFLVQAEFKTVSVVFVQGFWMDLFFPDADLHGDGVLYGVQPPFAAGIYECSGEFDVSADQLDGQQLTVDVVTDAAGVSLYFFMGGAKVGALLGAGLSTALGGTSGKITFRNVGARLTIVSPVDGLRLNHESATKQLSLTDKAYDPATGDYDGTLWQLIRQPDGTTLIRGQVSRLYLNHSIADRWLGLSETPYNSVTGEYDGTKWRLPGIPGGQAIQSYAAALFVNHATDTRALSLSDQAYQGVGDNYNGTIWTF